MLGLGGRCNGNKSMSFFYCFLLSITLIIYEGNNEWVSVMGKTQWDFPNPPPHIYIFMRVRVQVGKKGNKLYEFFPLLPHSPPSYIYLVAQEPLLTMKKPVPTIPKFSRALGWVRNVPKVREYTWNLGNVPRTFRLSFWHYGSLFSPFSLFNGTLHLMGIHYHEEFQCRCLVLLSTR